jgi:hypothetical protein
VPRAAEAARPDRRPRPYRRVVAEHRGRIVKLMGDGALCAFASVVDAVECALAIQRGMAERERDRPAAERILLRIGINLGDVVVEDDDLHGDGVNVAARLEPIAAPGGIVVSGTAYDHLQGKLACSFEPLGERRLKSSERPTRVYRVEPGTGADAAIPRPGRRTTWTGWSTGPTCAIPRTRRICARACGWRACWPDRDQGQSSSSGRAPARAQPGGQWREGDNRERTGGGTIPPLNFGRNKR